MFQANSFSEMSQRSETLAIRAAKRYVRDCREGADFDEKAEEGRAGKPRRRRKRTSMTIEGG